MVTAGENMRFNGHVGNPVFVEQAKDDRGGALVVVSNDQEGRRGVCGDDGRNTKRPGSIFHSAALLRTRRMAR